MTLIVTTAGLSASLDAANKGIKLKIKKIGFGSAGYVPDKTQTSLKSEFLRTEFTDSSISSNTLNMNVVFDDLNQSFDAKEVGYYLEDDMLFAVDSLDGAIISSKHKGSILTESFEIVLSDHLIDSITVDVVGVSRATESNVGIAKIATVDDAFDVENDSDIVTPKKMHDVLDGRVVNPNLFINGDFSINQRGENSHGWIADRWICGAGGLTGSLRYTTINLLDFATDRLVAKSAGALLKDPNTTYSYATITQKIEDFTPFIDNKITISGVLRVLDGGVYRTDTIADYFSRIQIRLVARGSFVGGASSNTSNWKFRVDDNDSRYVHFSTTLDLPPVPEKNITHADVIIWLTSTNLTWTAIDITNMKCEEGGTATIFVPDGHAANLAKCRLYCRKVELFDQGFALGYLATTAPHGFRTEVIDFTAGMRSLPAFTYGFYGENRMRIINLGAKTKASEIEQLALGGTVSAPRFEGVYTPPFSGTDDSFATLYFGTGWMLFEAEI